MKIIKILPLCQFPIQIHIVFVAHQLINFPLVRAMGTLHLSIEPRCPWLNVDMIDPKIGQMAVKFRREFMAVIHPDRVNPERELGQDIIDELDGVHLGMLPMNLQGSDTICIVVNGRVLKSTDYFPPGASYLMYFTSN